MSETGEAKDVFASKAKPRRAARVCERRRHATLDADIRSYLMERARRARRRASAAADTLSSHLREPHEEAA